MGLLSFVLVPKLLPAIFGVLLIALGILSIYYGGAIRFLRSLGFGLIIAGLVVIFGVSWISKALETTEGTVVLVAVGFVVLLGMFLFGRKKNGDE